IYVVHLSTARANGARRTALPPDRHRQHRLRSRSLLLCSLRHLRRRLPAPFGAQLAVPYYPPYQEIHSIERLEDVRYHKKQEDDQRKKGGSRERGEPAKGYAPSRTRAVSLVGVDNRKHERPCLRREYPQAILAGISVAQRQQDPRKLLLGIVPFRLQE